MWSVIKIIGYVDLMKFLLEDSYKFILKFFKDIDIQDF